MGYAQTNIVIYGIVLSLKQTEELHKAMINYFLTKPENLRSYIESYPQYDFDTIDDQDMMEILSNEGMHLEGWLVKEKHIIKVTPIKSSRQCTIINHLEHQPYHENKPINSFHNQPRRIHYANCWSHNADSRSNLMDFDLEEGNKHTFGIYCGSNGYAYMDDIVKIIQNKPAPAAVKNWKLYCKPIIDTLSFRKIKPTLTMCSQIW